MTVAEVLLTSIRLTVRYWIKISRCKNYTQKSGDSTTKTIGTTSSRMLNIFLRYLDLYMGVSKNRGTPKWMVFNGNPIKMDDLGVPLF